MTESQHDSLAERYGDRFPKPEDVPTHRIRVRLTDPKHFSPIDPSGWEMDFDQSFEEGSVALAGRNLLAEFQVGPSSHATVWISSDEGPHLEDLIGNCLRTLAAYAVLESGGVLLHSAGIVAGGAARLVIGGSGSGKTTLSRIALQRGLKVTSDDLNAVGPDSRLPSEHSPPMALLRLPFAGELGLQRAASNEPLSYPIHSIHLLSKSQPTEQREPPPVTTAQALANLVASACFLNRDPYRHTQLTENLLSLIERHPITTLDAGDPRAVDSLLDA